jgi:hypothetical protein
MNPLMVESSSNHKLVERPIVIDAWPVPEYMAAYHTLDNHKDDKAKNSDEKKEGTQRNPLMTAYLTKKIVKCC